MPHSAVLDLLAAHAAKALEPHESDMVTHTIRFVESHDDCLLRTQLSGHLTGSAWIVNPERSRTLLTHHFKLEKWLQLGGHADGESDLHSVAWREGKEESGLIRLSPVTAELFDIDQHLIPARKNEPEHFHFDLRFMFEADPTELLTVTTESRDLQWVDLSRVTELNPEESMARMVRKTLQRWL